MSSSLVLLSLSLGLLVSLWLACLAWAMAALVLATPTWLLTRLIVRVSRSRVVAGRDG